MFLVQIYVLRIRSCIFCIYSLYTWYLCNFPLKKHPHNDETETSKAKERAEKQRRQIAPALLDRRDRWSSLIKWDHKSMADPISRGCWSEVFFDVPRVVLQCNFSESCTPDLIFYIFQIVVKCSPRPWTGMWACFNPFSELQRWYFDIVGFWSWHHVADWPLIGCNWHVTPWRVILFFLFGGVVSGQPKRWIHLPEHVLMTWHTMKELKMSLNRRWYHGIVYADLP